MFTPARVRVRVRVSTFLNHFPPLCKQKTKRREKKKKSRWSTRPHIDRVFAQGLESGDSTEFAFLSTQTPKRPRGEIQAGASLLQAHKTPVHRDVFVIDDNRMGVEFREKLKRKPGVLFKLPTKHLTPRFHSKCCHEFDGRFSPMRMLAHSASLFSRSHYRTPSDHLAPPSKQQCFANPSSHFRRAPDHTKSSLIP